MLKPKWMPPPPCQHGDHVDNIDTPALMVDLESLERNLATMAAFMKKFPGVAWRPHAKAHKCPDIARMQIQHGACGICCQTLVEAEAMVKNGGPMDIFVSNQIIGLSKLHRLAALAKEASISICVDDICNILQLSQAAKEAGVNIDCVVEVCVSRRCGVKPGPEAANLAKEIRHLPGLTFKGIHVYGGQNQHIRSEQERSEAAFHVVEQAEETLRHFENEQIPCPYVTGGGTGTFPYEAGSGVFTEVQPGSFIFMDVDYSKNLNATGKPVEEFTQSLFVLTSVQSRRDGRAIVDVGVKGVSMDSGPPLILGQANIVYENGGDEHGKLKAINSTGQFLLEYFQVGDKMWLIPGHCDPTVNLHDYIIGFRNYLVETIWPVSGRGPGI